MRTIHEMHSPSNAIASGSFQECTSEPSQYHDDKVIPTSRRERTALSDQPNASCRRTTWANLKGSNIYDQENLGAHRPSIPPCHVLLCQCDGSRLAWKQAITISASSSTTKNSVYGKRRKRARRTFLNTMGNWWRLSIIRSITTLIAWRKRRPSPVASPSYQSCASISSSRAA